jgi:hypothetical protein
MRNADMAPLLILLLIRIEERNEGAHPLHQRLKRQASYRNFTSRTGASSSLRRARLLLDPW